MVFAYFIKINLKHFRPLLMKLTLYDIFLFFQWGCMVTSSIFSLALVGNKRIPKYMHKFYWYSIVASLFSLYNFFQKYFNISSKNALGFLHSTLLLFHFLFLSYFIYCALPNKSIPKFIKLLFFSFFFIIMTCLLANDLHKPQAAAFTFSSLGLVIFCCFYYSQL